MGSTQDRLHRLLEDQLEDCCEDDVQRRLEELEVLGERATAPADDRRALKTLGDGTRHRLARLLAAADRELCVCEITPLVEVSESAVSHALSDLAEGGLVTRRKEGTWHYYGTTPRAERLLGALEATDRSEPVRVAFVCVRNAGRSQMATAFAERERELRSLDVEIVTGGTHPADAVHGVVVEAMAEVGIDVSERTPREISTDELEACEYVATMGCSTLALETAVRDWDLADPGEAGIESVREIREEIRRRVRLLFDEIEGRER